MIWSKKRQPAAPLERVPAETLENTPQQVFLDHANFIESVARRAARRSGFSPEDVDDFVSTVHLKLIEKDYSVLRKFRGKSRMTTYLVTVVNNLCGDYRNRLWGRYRPSAAARRLGTTAVILEGLLVRDDCGLDSAIEIAKTRFEVREDRRTLVELASQLPLRVPRRRVGEEVLEEHVAKDAVTPDQGLAATERAHMARRVEDVLEDALRTLKPVEVLVLKLHLSDGLTLAAISRLLDLNQRQLYTLKERSQRQLHQYFQAQGLTWQQVGEILGWSEHEVRPILGGLATDNPSAASTEPIATPDTCQTHRGG